MNILQITSYPTVKPQHGGQIRCWQIARCMTEAGHNVTSLAIYPDWAYGDAGKLDIPIAHSSRFIDHSLPFFSDYFCGLHAVGDAGTREKLQRVIASVRPDVLLVEQPWNFDAAYDLKPAGSKIVYSSQNVEWRLKAGDPDHHDALVQAIRALEFSAVKRADFSVGCTQQDCDEFATELEAEDRMRVLVAGNGVEPFSCSDARVSDWLHYFGKPYAVFVSSAHPPNADGFWEMMAPGLTFLRPNEKVVVIGGVCNILAARPGFEAFADVNLSRLNMVGARDKGELQAMVRASHVVLLPITKGEGSNLKTAEALEAGVPIVGTRKAFRGYEQAMSLPHVTIADEPHAFRRAARRLLDSPRVSGCTPQQAMFPYYWNQVLAPFVARVSA